MSGPAHDVDYATVRELQVLVADAMLRQRQIRDAARAPALSAEDERQLSLSLTREVVSEHRRQQMREGITLPDPDADARLVAAVDAAIWGAGQLQALLDDPLVENIDINGCDETFISRADGRGCVPGPAVAATDDDLIALVRNLGMYNGLNPRPFDAANQQLDLRLGDGTRLSAVMGVSERPAISLRRNRFPQMFLDQVPAGVVTDPGTPEPPATLLELGTIDEHLAGFLRAAVLARANIIVAGATNAGKTTLLRALINCIPAEERLITVERALELGIRRHRYLHPNTVEMEEILPGAEDTEGVSIGDLVRRSLRMNPSRVIVGEVLGPEVVDMLNAMSQGNDGSLSTIHARSAVNVFTRLANYAEQFSGRPHSATYGLIADSIDYVIFVQKNPLLGGRRTVCEVLEVTGSSEGHVTRDVLFRPSPVDGRAVRDVEVAIGAQRAEALRQAGYDDVAWSHSWGPYQAGPGAPGYPPGPIPHSLNGRR
jgi:pilus assembly protein CpaF